LIKPLSGTGFLFGNSFPELNWGGIAEATAMAFQGTIAAFVHQCPIVVLVVRLVWIWLTRHPSRHAETADTAEV
jgi:hypothetical protein